MELELSTVALPPRDRRPFIPEPPRVRLIAVEDVVVPAAAGFERELDQFYIDLLRFERDHKAEASESDSIVYRAQNGRLVFRTLEPPITRPDFRPIRIEVDSSLELENKLISLERSYERLKGFTPGEEMLLLQDPAGNWIGISQNATVR